MGKYSNVNVNKIQSVINEDINSIRSHSKKLETMSDKLNGHDFDGSRGTKLISTMLDKVVSSKSIKGSVESLCEYLKKISKALTEIKDYQEIEKEYKIAVRTREDIQRDPNESSNIAELTMAKANETRLRISLENKERDIDNILN